jgi:hypothetical protein
MDLLDGFFEYVEVLAVKISGWKVTRACAPQDEEISGTKGH